MNITIVYDSIFGNTAKIAAAIAETLKADDNHVTLLTVQEGRALDLGETDLLVVGSPTRGFRPTPQISEYVAGLNKNDRQMAVAVFDTRMDLNAVKPRPLRWAVGIGGYAATRVADAARRRGFPVREDQGAFLVSGMQGPLKDGEIEHARQWATTLLH